MSLRNKGHFFPRSTGYSSGSSGGGSWKRPPNYPESLFSRLPLPERFISLAVAKLRSDDLYFRVARCYPGIKVVFDCLNSVFI